jgi:predicted alpha/beta hydrolase
VEWTSDEVPCWDGSSLAMKAFEPAPLAEAVLVTWNAPEVVGKSVE